MLLILQLTRRLFVFMLHYGTWLVRQRDYVRQFIASALKRNPDHPVLSLVTILPTISRFLVHQTHIKYMSTGYFL
jgi:hypothetical protein